MSCPHFVEALLVNLYAWAMVGIDFPINANASAEERLKKEEARVRERELGIWEPVDLFSAIFNKTYREGVVVKFAYGAYSANEGTEAKEFFTTLHEVIVPSCGNVLYFPEINEVFWSLPDGVSQAKTLSTGEEAPPVLGTLIKTMLQHFFSNIKGKKIRPFLVPFGPTLNSMYRPTRILGIEILQPEPGVVKGDVDEVLPTKEVSEGNEVNTATEEEVRFVGDVQENNEDQNPLIRAEAALARARGVQFRREAAPKSEYYRYAVREVVDTLHYLTEELGSPWPPQSSIPFAQRYGDLIELTTDHEVAQRYAAMCDEHKKLDLSSAPDQEFTYEQLLTFLGDRKVHTIFATNVEEVCLQLEPTIEQKEYVPATAILAEISTAHVQIGEHWPRHNRAVIARDMGGGTIELQTAGPHVLSLQKLVAETRAVGLHEEKTESFLTYAQLLSLVQDKKARLIQDARSGLFYLELEPRAGNAGKTAGAFSAPVSGEKPSVNEEKESRGRDGVQLLNDLSAIASQHGVTWPSEYGLTTRAANLYAFDTILITDNVSSWSLEDTALLDKEEPYDRDRMASGVLQKFTFPELLHFLKGKKVEVIKSGEWLFLKIVRK